MNNAPAFILKQSLSDDKTRFIWNKLRRLWVESYEDSGITYTLYGKQISLPLSHQLPIYLKQYPYYDTLLTRIGQYLREIDGKLSMIDIGANIGDSILATYPKATDDYIAIEPSDKFFVYLSKNLQSYDNIVLINKFITQNSDDTNYYQLIENNGTASISQDLSNQTMPPNATTIDALIKQHEKFKEINFLKVDTDGFDIECLNSAKNLINASLPLILFECDDFGQKDYQDKILELFVFLKKAGYSQFILYDNFGVLMMVMDFSGEDLSHFKNLLNYKMKSNFYYFDIVVMPPRYETIITQEFTHFA